MKFLNKIVMATENMVYDSLDYRKPNTGMLQRKNADITIVLLKTGYGEKKLEFDIPPDAIYNNLLEFAEKLPNAEKRIVCEKNCYKKGI